MALPEAAGEDIAKRRKRVRFRAWHRGTREMDLILGPFADAWLPTLDAGQLDRLELLMEEPDTELLKWVMGQEAIPNRVDREILERVTRDHQKRMQK